MRLFIIGLSLALTTSAPLAATAQGPAPVSTQPLAPGEVLLEVNALGHVTTRADRASLSFNVSGSGETDAAARAAVERNLAEVRALLRTHGVAEADIRAQPITAWAEAAFADANTMVAYDVTADSNSVAAQPTATANAQTEIVIRNVGNVPAIQAALMERGIYAAGGANYALNDDSVPRRQARVQALQKARADADAYAASLNMRVARVVRVTERLGLDLLGLAATESQLVGQLFMSGLMRTGAAEVPTVVAVGVDFALAPR